MIKIRHNRSIGVRGAKDIPRENFRARAPNRLWVADLTYVSAWSGFVYVAFVIDAFSYTERLAEAGAVRSVGSRGDSFDNALAETMVGLYKTELINRRGPWRTLEQVELATAEWTDWWNQRRLHGATDNLPPAELERRWWEQSEAQVA